MRFDVGILATQPVPAIVRQVELAESLGYTTAWMTDTHLVCRELWVTLAACAAATRTIRLGPGVTVPHTRHVSVTASAILTLEEMAPGRVVLGIGTGGSSAQTMGLRLEEVGRASRLETMATALRRLTRKEAVRLDSGADARVAWLAGPRRIPLYLAGSGPRMLATAGRLGDGVIMYASTSPPILRAGLDCIAAGAAAAGRTLADLDVVLWAPTSVARDGAVARDHVRGRVASAARHPLPVALGPEDQAAVRRIRDEYDAFQHATAASPHRTLVPDRLVDLLALAGTTAEVAAQARRIAVEVPEISRIILLPQAPGSAGDTERAAIMRLFAEEVMPRIG